MKEITDLYLAPRPPMNLVLEGVEGDVIRLSIAGDFAPGLGDSVHDVMEAQVGIHCYRKTLLLNLGRAGYVSSAGVSWLVHWHNSCVAGGGKLILHSLPPLVERVLKMLKMDVHLNLAKDELSASQLKA